MDIQHKDTESKGEFFIEKDGERIGELTYTHEDSDVITIDHTEVSDDYRGQGLAKKLVLKSVDYARENELSIKPVCPYTKVVLEKDEDLHDVLLKDD